MKQIIVDANDYEMRIALVEDDVLTEFFIEREERPRMVGSIYKGKVANVLPGMESAFVNIGLPKNSFLYATMIIKKPFPLGEPAIAKDEYYSKEYTKYVLKKDFILDGKLICKYEG